MEDSKKKPLLIGIIIACFVLAVVITIATRSSNSGGIESIPEDSTMWVKCDNPKCNAKYQMNQREYYKFVTENTGPADLYAPPMTCKECGEQSVYKAIKCPKCGEVFYSGAAGKRIKDTCPKCGFSKKDDIYKKAIEKAAKNRPGV